MSRLPSHYPTAISIYLVNGTDYEKNLAPRLLSLGKNCTWLAFHCSAVPISELRRPALKPGSDLHASLNFLRRPG
jgi:hypothetical protein